MGMPPMTLPGDMDMAAPSPAAPSPAPSTNAKGKGKGKAKAKPKESAATTTKKKKTSKAEKLAASINNNSASGGGDSGLPNEGLTTGSRSGSTIPNQTTAMNTPTKKKGVGAKGRGGKGRASTRAESRGGSRATSARASMSVVPGQNGGNTYHREEEAYVEQQEEEEEDEGEEEVDNDEEVEEDLYGQGLEEDEWQRQEAIQKARSTAMGPLMKAMDDVQQDRYAVYRQSFLHKNTVRRVSLIQILYCSVTSISFTIFSASFVAR